MLNLKGLFCFWSSPTLEHGGPGLGLEFGHAQVHANANGQSLTGRHWAEIKLELRFKLEPGLMQVGFGAWLKCS